MAHEIAGDPMGGLRWTHRTTHRIAAELASLGIHVCARTVARLLREIGFALRVNHKKLCRQHPGREAQFTRINALRARCQAEHLPIISVDSKKMELIGPFKNPGVKWDREPEHVKDHDFRSEADALATPYGIYDLNANCGTVFVGTSYDTPGFAVDCIEKWWRTEGRKRYPGVTELHILADTGGSNGCTCRAFKHGLQHRLCSRHGITVNVCHYPTGTSKWNPIEHRLFSEISKNWAARPLDTIDTMLRYIRTTTTQTGLAVRAHLVRKPDVKGVKIPDHEMKALSITPTASYRDGTIASSQPEKSGVIFARTPRFSPVPGEYSAVSRPGR